MRGGSQLTFGLGELVRKNKYVYKTTKVFVKTCIGNDLWICDTLNMDLLALSDCFPQKHAPGN